MSQDDQAVANAPGATVRADINANLQALVTLSSGATAPATTWAYQVWADTTSGLLKQRNAANSGWLVRGTLAETFVLARSSNTIVGVGDFGRVLNCTSTFSQTLTAAATLGDGFMFGIRNNGAGVITIDPNGAETINGSATIDLQPGDSALVFCNGAAFVTIGFSPQASSSAAGLIQVASQAEMEAGSSLVRAVAPGRQHFHPSAAKVWALLDFSTTPLASYNVSSITETGAGDNTVNFTTAFSSTSYAVVTGKKSSQTISAGVALKGIIEVDTYSTGSVRLKAVDFVGSTNTTSLADQTSMSVTCFGDQ